MYKSARLKLAFLGWAAAYLFFTAILLASDLGHKPPGFALYATSVHFAIWTIALPLLERCTRAFPLGGSLKVRNAGMLLLIVVALAASVMLVHWSIVFSTFFPDRSADPTLTFRSFMTSELVRFLPVDVLIGIILVVALEGWRAWKNYEAERTRATELERQLAVSRLDALRMQLHPHFLFNALNALAGLIVEQPPTARRMVIALGDFLRLTLRDTDSPVRSLAEELEFSDLYLGIEKLRLGDRLALNYDIEPDTTSAEVPQLLLQPLFENAIRHGAARTVGSCEIHFYARRERDQLCLTVCNEGPARPQSLGPPKFGVGLGNTMARLRLHYKDQFTFQYTDRPQGGAQIDLSIPYRRAASKRLDRFALAPNLVSSDTRELDAADPQGVTCT
jgi:two-component system, LytTR family, sensor kinase